MRGKEPYYIMEEMVQFIKEKIQYIEHQVLNVHIIQTRKIKIINVV